MSVCLKPVYMRKQDANVNCGKCRNCIGNLVNFKASQAVMESVTADKSVAVTLTFSPEYDEHAHTLNKKIFQEWMQDLRNEGSRQGFTIRYVVAGEYGSLRGRVHFHALLFFRGKNIPEFAIREERWNWDLWPYGFTYADDVDYKSARYVAKYMSKDLTATNAINKSWLSGSRRPELGHEYYKRRANENARQMVVPSGSVFRIPEARRSSTVTGHPDAPKKMVRFVMPPHVSNKFLTYFLEAWQRHHGDRPIPESNDFIVKWLDKQARAEMDAQQPDLKTRLKAMNKFWSPTAVDRLTTFRVAVGGEYIVARTSRGDYIARLHDDAGDVMAEQILYSRRAIKAALKGQARFKTTDFYSSPVTSGKVRPRKADFAPRRKLSERGDTRHRQTSPKDEAASVGRKQVQSR